MTSLDDLLESAVKDGTAPGIVVIAKDKDGKSNQLAAPVSTSLIPAKAKLISRRRSRRRRELHIVWTLLWRCLP